MYQNEAEGASTLCRAAECRKMWPCHAANGEDNVDVNVVRLRQGFCIPRHENSIDKMSVSSKVCCAAYDESGVSKWHQPVTEKNQTKFTDLIPQFL